MYTTLITIEALQAAIDRPDWVIVDCRFSLADTEKGRRAYQEAHIPGAFYAHLDDDLSGRVIKGETGRHPLPCVAALIRLFSSWGIQAGVQVVAYDDLSGAIAARLWWMLRWLGHDAVAVLEGGLPAWEAGGLTLSSAIPSPVDGAFEATPRPEMLVDGDFVETIAQSPQYQLIDSRTPERYRGESEPIDPVAGHIPGAVNAPHPQVVGSEGQWRSPEVLREQYQKVLDGVNPEKSVFYCGSGVTACRNILGMEHAGLQGSKLYAGSWSEWITRD